MIDDPPEWVEVRREAFIPDATFAAINAERESRGEALFANPRNACAGTLRQLDFKAVARRVDFFVYTLHLPSDAPRQPDSQWAVLQWLEQAASGQQPGTGCRSERHPDLLRPLQQRHDLLYATDGALNDLRLQDEAGFTQAPRRAIVSPRRGSPHQPLRGAQVLHLRLTPVATEPVALAGTSVSRATLHNADRIAELDLHVSTIVVRKAGEIILEVVVLPSCDLPLPAASSCGSLP